MEYTYSSYQVPATTQLPYVIWQLLSEVSRGGNPRNVALGKLDLLFYGDTDKTYKAICQLVAEKFFNVELDRVTKGHFSVYVCVTRHLVSIFLTRGNGNANVTNTVSEMYFCDVQITDNNQPPDIDQPIDGIPAVDKATNKQKVYPAPTWTPSLEIKEMRFWKMNLADTNALFFSWNTSTAIGIRSNKKKFPLLGITEKKLIVPPSSFFMEGMHVDCYGYPYEFLQVYSSSAYIANENWLTNYIKPVFYNKK